MGGEEYEDCCAQAYMALALLYVTRSVSSEPAVLGVELFGAAPRILSAMREVLVEGMRYRDQLQERQQQQQGEEVEDKYANARLWALFAGAHGEQVAARLKYSASAPVVRTPYTTTTDPVPTHTTASTSILPASPRFTPIDPDSDPSRSGWFNKTLALASRQRGINSWFALRQILQGFVYSDNIPPNGTDWFYRTMSGAFDA